MAVIEKFQQKHWLGPVKRACDRLRKRAPDTWSITNFGPRFLFPLQQTMSARRSAASSPVLSR